MAFNKKMAIKILKSPKQKGGAKGGIPLFLVFFNKTITDGYGGYSSPLIYPLFIRGSQGL
jgi:hypothetical protein